MLTLVPGGMGGSETYARELIRELADRPLQVATLVSPVGQGFSSGVPVKVAQSYRTGQSQAQRTVALLLGTLQGRSLSRQLAGASVVHYPFTVPVPAARDGQRTVVSLLDVQ